MSFLSEKEISDKIKKVEGEAAEQAEVELVQSSAAYAVLWKTAKDLERKRYAAEQNAKSDLESAAQNMSDCARYSRERADVLCAMAMLKNGGAA